MKEKEFFPLSQETIKKALKKEIMEKPLCKLIGEDGNVFAIIGRVSKTLKRAGLIEEAKEFIVKASCAKSYDEVLCLCTEYVEVE